MVPDTMPSSLHSLLYLILVPFKLGFVFLFFHHLKMKERKPGKSSKQFESKALSSHYNPTLPPVLFLDEDDEIVMFVTYLEL